jgi:hypothetical protein
VKLAHYILATYVVGLSTVACTASQAAKTESAAEEAAAISCIVANFWRPDDKAIQAACDLAPRFWPLIRPTAAETQHTVGLALARKDGRR